MNEDQKEIELEVATTRGRKKDLEVKVLAHPTAVESTQRAIYTTFAGLPGRQDQARSFIKKAKKSDRRRKIEKMTRRRMRRK